jgi:hypothetical protein
MYLKILLNLIFIIFLSLFQISFISGLPSFFNNINFVLVVIIFILVLTNFKFSFYWFIGIGFLLDIYSFLPFGFYLICLFITLLFSNFLLNNFFTNRSMYSFLALTFFSTCFYIFIFNLIKFFLQIFADQTTFFIFIKEFWINFLSQISLNLILAVILFYLINFLSNKLKPVFLLKNK